MPPCGPGASSNIGLFEELGPWRIDQKSGKLLKSEGAWNGRYSLLFLDSPVGTGFSYVYQGKKKKSVPIREVLEDDQPVYQEGYAMNQRAIARDLLKVLDDFYKQFPKLKKSPLYIAGESYAGKYVPHFAEEIHKYNINQRGVHDTIPLKGLAIGDGLTDPISQIKAHAPLALAMGFVSVEQANSMTDVAEKARDLIRQQKWIEANTVRQSLFEYFTNVTGGVNWYDIRKGSTLNNHDSLNAFLSRVDVRRALNVCVNNEAPDPCASFEDDSDNDSDHPGYYRPKAPTVYDHLLSDIMKSAKPVVQSLLDQGYKTLLYQGQFDFRDGPLGQTEWIDSMGWHGGSGYRAAHRTVWRVGQDVAGYITEYANLRRVELLLAGHLAPGDQLVWTRHMIEDFVEREVTVSS
ncbi:hypothetical protein HDU85_000428 [Gaertneriomyces sp. JEL0708]|nr:hypothetical protein HDU85_000428 [Gaertneriomyces sp. JEL0708]